MEARGQDSSFELGQSVIYPVVLICTNLLGASAQPTATIKAHLGSLSSVRSLGDTVHPRGGLSANSFGTELRFSGPKAMLTPANLACP